MGFTYSFVDSSIYGTEDINDITRSLTGAGIAPFLTKDSYDISDLNVMTSALVAEGTSLDGCKCSVENAGTEEMTVTIAQGIVFFESGVRLTVDEEGYNVAVTPNTAGYVYAHYSLALQKADIVFDTELPSDGEYVILAEIAADGGIQDKRTFARSKIATIGKNIKLTPSFERVEPELFEIDDKGEYIYILAKAPAVDLSRFNYALVFSPESNKYEILDLAEPNRVVYLETMYTYGPINIAQVIEGRLCVKQNVNGNGTHPYVPNGFGDRLLSYKIILV